MFSDSLLLQLFLATSVACIGFRILYPIARGLFAKSKPSPVALSSPPPALEKKEVPATPRTIVGGRYELLEVLGEGGFAVTYRALDIETGEYCAVKALRHADEKHYRMLQNEVRVFRGATGHRNVVGFKSYFEEDGKCFIAMELVEGKTLVDAVEEGLLKDNDRTIKHVFLQILDAIEYLHSKGIYHRDLKTENILLTKEWTVKIIDFGESTTTLENFSCRGTESYRPPEAFTSRLCNSAEMDKWALGQILLEMSTVNRCLWDHAKLEDQEYRRYLYNVQRGNIMYFHQELPVSPSVSVALFMALHPHQESRTSIQALRAQLKEAGRIVDVSGLSPERRERYERS